MHTSAPYVRSTRLKEKLLSDIPACEAHKSGRDVLLSFTEDTGSILSKASDFSDAIILSKAANILQKHIWLLTNGNLMADSMQIQLKILFLQLFNSLFAW